MSKIKIFWDPSGFEIDKLGKKKYLRITDGDTPYIALSVRMLSIDTPETHYPGNSKPSKQDNNLLQLARWIEHKKAPIDEGLGEYLYPKLVSGKAGTLHEEQGKMAMKIFDNMLKEKLHGRRKNIFVRVADEPFDNYGRLLAYIAPYYTPKERERLSRRERATFNLLMVESGYAAPFLIYPSLPRYEDLVLFHDVAKDAYEEKRGLWKDNNTLTGYEFRMCVRLYGITKQILNGKRVKQSWIERYCADITTRQVFIPQDYYKVKPYNRLFIWPNDISDAVSKLNLSP